MSLSVGCKDGLCKINKCDTLNEKNEKLYCRRYTESCNNIGYQLMVTTVNKLDRNYNGSTGKTNTVIIQCYKAQTCPGQAHLSINSANTRKA